MFLLEYFMYTSTLLAKPFYSYLALLNIYGQIEINKNNYKIHNTQKCIK